MKVFTKLLGILMLAIGISATSDAQTLNTWVNGSNATKQNGVYGTLGVADAANVPGARYTCATWTDASGNLWLFGGYGYAATGTGISQMNDMWKYNIASGQWTWMGGSTSALQNGVYGTKGTADPANIPGARQLPITWKDASGNFWLFGGSGIGASGASTGNLNDLWKYNPSTNQWTWVSGSTLTNQNGVYGTKGTADAANTPGGRYGSATWTDASGNFWLLGGQGYPASGTSGSLNDLWKYNPTTNQWTWMAGNNTNNAVGIYGTKGTPDAANMPGARYMGLNWTDASGNFWLFGGVGYSAAASGSLNDLWKYNVGTSQWTWVSGDSVRNINGVYGTMGTAASTNKPGGRQRATSFTDALGNLWLFGGLGYAGSGASTGNLNDWWKYNIASGQWTWITGDSVRNKNGIYGTQGVAANTNMPGSRYGANGWTDGSGNFWMFGGNAYPATGSATYINDLWKIATYNTWIGGTSTDWSTAANWSYNSVPVASDIVMIPPQTNQPVIGNGTAATATQVVIQSGAILTLNGSGTLTAGMNITVNAGGALFGNSSNVTGTVTLQQNVVGQRGWRIFSNPFSTAQTIATVASNNNITINTTPQVSGLTDSRTFSNSTNTWSNVTGTTWAANTPYSLFIRGLASEVTGATYTGGPTPFTYSVSGTLNGGSVAVTPASTSNFIIVGNPYAAPVKTSALTNGAGVSYYVYQIAQGGNTTLQRTKAGSWSAVLSSSATTTIPVLGVIAYKPSSTSSYNISTASALLTGGTLQTGLFRTQQEKIAHIELQVQQNDLLQDKLFVRLDDKAQDKGTDATDLEKFYNENVNFYTKTTDNKLLAIDARAELDSIPLGINGLNGDYTLKLANNDLPTGTLVYLQDNYLHTTTQLQPNALYAFSINSNEPLSKGENRFVLRFSKPAILTGGENFTVKVLGNRIEGNSIRIAVAESTSPVTITLVDALGRVIYTKSNINNGETTLSIPSAISNGVVFLQASNGKSVQTQKLTKE